MVPFSQINVFNFPSDQINMRSIFFWDYIDNYNITYTKSI